MQVVHDVSATYPLVIERPARIQINELGTLAQACDIHVEPVHCQMQFQFLRDESLLKTLKFEHQLSGVILVKSLRFALRRWKT